MRQRDRLDNKPPESLRRARGNAALVEEASAAAHSMAEQAQALRDAVAVFKLADTDLCASRAVIPQSKPSLPALKTRSTARVPVRSSSATTTPPQR